MNPAHKENILHYKIRLLNDESGYTNKEFNSNYKKF